MLSDELIAIGIIWCFVIFALMIIPSSRRWVGKQFIKYVVEKRTKTGKKKRYRCTECGNIFYTEEPSATIPVSVVWCPRCDKLAERFDEED